MRPISLDSPTNRRIVAALEKHGPMNVDELSEKACVARTTLVSGFYYLTALVKAGRVHICAWTRATELGRSGPPQATYKAGPEKQAKRPDPLPDTVRVKKYRNSPKYDGFINRRRLRRGGTAAIDPTLAAMMGLTAKATA